MGLITVSLLQGCHDGETHHPDDDQLKAQGPNCFASGTRILTPKGYFPIEDIRIGDDIIVSGQERRKVVWIGKSHQSITTSLSWTHVNRPLCISKGSLDGILPIADLRLSRDHRLYWHGMLVRALEFSDNNSIAIDCNKNLAEIDYYHILVEGTHTVLFAEGVPCETLLLSPQILRKFDNFDTLESGVDCGLNAVVRPYAPVFAGDDSGYRASISSHVRIAFSPWIDRRTPADEVRQALLTR
jgi:hypothetical protein